MADEKQIALVTGAGRGIGRAIAESLAANGYAVVIVARTTTEINELKRELAARGHTANAFACDVSSSLDVDLLHTKIEKEVGEVSVLVNNAGVAPSEKLENTTDELWHHTIAVNLTGPFYLSRAFVPGMKKLGGGHIINIASTAAHEGFAYTSAYTASKHGLLGLTRALAVELKRANIQVNAICPGFVRTQIVETSIRNIAERTRKSHQESEAELAKLNKEGRLIEPEEVAERVLALIGDRTITGQAIDIHGINVD